MELEQRVVGDVVVIKVTGDITLDHGGDVLLKDKMQSLLLEGYRNLLLDLGGVLYMDSAGLGQMVQAYVNTRNRGGSLRLLRVTKRLHNLLVVTRLLTVFDAYDSEADALASFGARAT
jgi:anti-sigma B factor antagonist